jgi:hypothetical protein
VVVTTDGDAPRERARRRGDGGTVRGRGGLRQQRSARVHVRIMAAIVEAFNHIGIAGSAVREGISRDTRLLTLVNGYDYRCH